MAFHREPEDVIAGFVDHAAKMTETVYIGIDSGAEGAIGFLCGRHAEVISIPTLKVSRAKGTKTVFNNAEIVRLFKLLRPVKDRIVVVLEQAQVQVKGKGANAYTGFRVGVGYGMWGLFLCSKGYSLEEVVPAVWKKAMGLSGVASSGNTAKDSQATKERSRAKALQLWPKADLKLKKDHNKAEAMLLAAYGQRKYEGSKQ